MPKYFYTAKTFDGQTRMGTVDASDERQLAQVIKGEGMILVKATVNNQKGRFSLSIPMPFLGVSLAEKIMFTKNIGVMFSTGLSLAKIFDILAAQSRSKQLKNALSDIREQVNKGKNLSDALGMHPAIFSDLYINMIKAGEESGTLEEVFAELAIQLTKEHELRSKIKNAMAYPAIILAVMAIVGVVIITFVLPSLNVFFASLNVEIPWYTKMLISLGSFLSLRWYVLLVTPFLLIVLFISLVRTKKGKLAIDAFSLKMPVISTMVKKGSSAFLIRALSSLIASGVSLTRSLEITSRIAGNYYFKEAIIEAGEKIKKGEKLSLALKAHADIFPFGVVEMIEVGEETGKTSVILKKLADFYEQEAVAAVERVSVLIEPALIITLGLAVGFFAVSIIGPIYSSLNTINQQF